MDNNLFAKLAARAERGEPLAELQLRQQLEPELVHIVRCTLHTGNRRTAQARRILEEARRLALVGFHGPDNSEQLIHKIAHVLCDSIVAGLRSRPSRGALMHETICDLGRPNHDT